MGTRFELFSSRVTSSPFSSDANPIIGGGGDGGALLQFLSFLFFFSGLTIPFSLLFKVCLSIQNPLNLTWLRRL